MNNWFSLSIALFITACGSSGTEQNQSYSAEPAHSDSLLYPGENHFSNIRQLTFGGNNAEAYWSHDGTHLIFQSDNRNWNLECDQIFLLSLDERPDSTKRKRISTGKGRTTCSWFMPGDKSILFASTHLGGEDCPAAPPRGDRYVWPLYTDYDIFVANLDGVIMNQLTRSPRYDAEATISPLGDKIVFTSLRSGDLELYTMNPDGSGVRQITHTPGYDGGATFSPDGTMIVWRASRPNGEKEMAEYQELLSRDMVEPGELEIWIAKADGTEARQVTQLGGANWSPTFTPDGQHIVFCSNHHSERGFPFNLFRIAIDGTGLKQITFDSQFDSFPMFSPDGKKIVWCSNRNNGRTRDTNIFIADWID